MPAAAVIPAPIAYIKVVAVKKLVVGFLVELCLARCRFRRVSAGVASAILLENSVCPSLGRSMRSRSFTLKKLECLKQAYAMNTLAWNNNLGLRFYFVGF